MKTLKITTQFKKDLKRYKNRPKVIEKLGYLECKEQAPPSSL